MHQGIKRLEPCWQIAIMGWSVYFINYFLRYSYSAAMVVIGQTEGLDIHEMGLIASILFATYGFGQFFSGFLEDRLNPKVLVFCGILGSTISNVLMGVSSNIAIMRLAWGMNGICSSLYWGPIVQLLAIYVPKERLRGMMRTFTYWSGIRSGELLALSLRDFDFAARTVTIDKNYARLDKEDLILEPKTPKSNRTIGIPKRVCDMVKDYASRLVDYEDGDRLFDVTKGFLYHEMKRISEQSGVKKIRIHDVRHSHASLLIELGTNILLVSERLGHEDVETTLEIYGHLYPKKDEEVAGRLERLCA